MELHASGGGNGTFSGNDGGIGGVAGNESLLIPGATATVSGIGTAATLYGGGGSGGQVGYNGGAGKSGAVIIEWYE